MSVCVVCLSLCHLLSSRVCSSYYTLLHTEITGTVASVVGVKVTLEYSSILLQGHRGRQCKPSCGFHSFETPQLLKLGNEPITTSDIGTQQLQVTLGSSKRTYARSCTCCDSESESTESDQIQACGPWSPSKPTTFGDTYLVCLLADSQSWGNPRIFDNIH